MELVVYLKERKTETKLIMIFLSYRMHNSKNPTPTFRSVFSYGNYKLPNSINFTNLFVA